MLLTTGLRPQEVFGLRRADIGGACLTVANVLDDLDTWPRTLKPAREPRTIELPEVVALALNAHLATHDDPKAVFQWCPLNVRDAWNNTPAEEKRVFPYTSTVIQKAWRAALRSAGVSSSVRLELCAHR